MRKSDKVVVALLNAVWVSRWNKNKTALTAVLTTEEAELIVDDIFLELEKIGYEIRRKSSKK